MITELVGSYSLILVATSYLVAVAASFAALSLAGRVAVSHGLGKVVWLAAGSMAMGSGIWSMHFVGMLAPLGRSENGYRDGGHPRRNGEQDLRS